nr:polysaccharide deacetylase family protein [Ectobacillus panaciterrae]
MLKSMVSLFIMLCLFCADPSVHAEMIKRTEVEPTGQVIWNIQTPKKIIALTFDDGPNPVYTPQILDLLKQYNGHATFFEIGYRMECYPSVVSRVVQEGHELGNHTMTHSYANRVTLERMQQDIMRAQLLIEKWQPNGPLYFRPPGGYIDQDLLEASHQQGYKIILWAWHQDPRDWASPGSDKIVDHVIKQAHNGDIVLLHDGGGDQSQTVEALKTILPSLQKQGYKFVTVSQLLKMTNH